MSRMNDEDVGRLLRELPRSQASAGFTERVLGKLDRGEQGARNRRRGITLGVAASLVLASVLVSGYLRDRFEQSRAAERVQALREEYRELQIELEKLRSLAREVEPILDLGGTDDVDFVLDLRELGREAPGGERGPGAEPASHSPR